MLLATVALGIGAGRAHAQPTRLAGWPQELAAGVSGGYLLSPMEGVAFADLDGDGKKELIASSGDRIWVYGPDGNAKAGWPQTVQGTAQAPPAVGDIDGDGKLEVVQIARGLRYSDPTFVHAFEADGTPVKGWPLRIPNLVFRTASLADLDGDGGLDVVLQIGHWPPGGMLEVYSGDGKPLSPWRFKLDALPIAPAAIADIDGDGALELAHATSATLTIRDQQGQPVLGTPLPAPDKQVFTGGLLLADISSSDAGLELIYLTKEDTQNPLGKAWLHVRTAAGAELSGFPVLLGADIADVGVPSAGDIAGDGVMVIAVPLRDKGVALIDATGKALAASPIGVSGEEVNASVALADLDGDGDLELVFDRNRWDPNNNNAGWLDAFHHDGTAVANFPLIVAGSTFFNGPTLADIDGDGTLEIGVLTSVNANPPRAFVELWTVAGSKASTPGFFAYGSGARRAGCLGCAAASTKTYAGDGPLPD
ncbi:MAG: VCBS repeat-containing protein, partial [Myxococcales bacterium]|nr:VCBS repeat-containing protein [Myxococcales bacterium]